MELMKKMNISMALAWLITGMVFFCSCSGSDYINAIPANSSALVSIDMQKMAESNPQASKTGVLKSLLHVEDVTDCGIDVSEKMYLFETVDGNLGLCAKVSDAADLEDWLNKLSKEQKLCENVTEKKGFHFSVLKNSWLVGFSDQALLIMGPVVADAQAELQRMMIKYLMLLKSSLLPK